MLLSYLCIIAVIIAIELLLLKALWFRCGLEGLGWAALLKLAGWLGCPKMDLDRFVLPHVLLILLLDQHVSLDRLFTWWKQRCKRSSRNLQGTLKLIWELAHFHVYLTQLAKWLHWLDVNQGYKEKWRTELITIPMSNKFTDWSILFSWRKC